MRTSPAPRSPIASVAPTETGMPKASRMRRQRPPSDTTSGSTPIQRTMLSLAGIASIISAPRPAASASAVRIARAASVGRPLPISRAISATVPVVTASSRPKLRNWICTATPTPAIACVPSDATNMKSTTPTSDCRANSVIEGQASAHTESGDRRAPGCDGPSAGGAVTRRARIRAR